MKTGYSVYRFYNEQGQLLYVGMSCNTISRFLSHRLRTQWFEEIATIKIQKFPNKEETLKAESVAVKDENPLYNIKLTKKKLPLEIRKRKETWINRIKREKAELK